MRKSWSSLCQIKIYFFTIVMLVISGYLFFAATQSGDVILRRILRPTQDAVSHHREIAAQLADITRALRSGECKVDPRILLRLNTIVGQLDPRVALSDYQMLTSARANSSENATETERETDVCGNTHNFSRGDYLFYQQNEPPLCNGKVRKRPISELITIVINNVEKDSKTFPERLQTMLDGIRGYHLFVPVLVGDVNITYTHKTFLLARTRGNVRIVNVESRYLLTPGVIWNLLMRQVKTPYVLIAKDLSHFNAYARLERQIYMISVSDYVGVAGGAFRNLTGHWKVGCYQTDIRNYFLRIVEGYKHSAYGCMFCDHLEGPFVARTSLLREIKFSEDLPVDVLFNDWFLRVKQANMLVVNCPDVMYFTQGRNNLYEQSHQKQNSWLALAKQWDVHRIFVPPNIIYLFSCKEVGLSCRSGKRLKEHLMPSCCLVQMARAWKTLDEFAARYGIGYELQSGTLLGAVKLRSHLPWDVGADVHFDTREYLTFYKKQKVFNVKGLKLKSFNPEEKGYFQLWTPEINIQMWGTDTLTSIFLPADVRETPTRVYMLGAWVRGVANPGLYAWNKYGMDYLKHAPVGSFSYYNSSIHAYPIWKWPTCPKPQHHACLDHYPMDGSIDFVPQMVH
ncbi:uncharacterized protein [Periplaneta americana]|uniref:uncharacterized protein n=1 Tax=Periplaneta americana TaxID=6978 RepID=UPI0037E8D0B5